MADSATSNYSFVKAEVGASEDTWGGKLNGNWDDLDTLLGGITAVQFAYLDVTALGTSEASKAVTADANGVVTLADGLNEGFATVTSSSGTATIDCRTATVFSITLSENTTFAFSNAPTSGIAYGLTLKIVQDSTARTVTWPAAVKWASNIEPDISTGSGQIDIFVLFTHDGGTNWYGFLAGQDMS
jgi:hypothetical protein